MSIKILGKIKLCLTIKLLNFTANTSNCLEIFKNENSSLNIQIIKTNYYIRNIGFPFILNYQENMLQDYCFKLNKSNIKFNYLI